MFKEKLSTELLFLEKVDVDRSFPVFFIRLYYFYDKVVNKPKLI